MIRQCLYIVMLYLNKLQILPQSQYFRKEGIFTYLGRERRNERERKKEYNSARINKKEKQL